MNKGAAFTSIHTQLATQVVSACAQVAANQFLLAPIVLCSVFSWNLAMQGKAREIPAKVQRDLWPTMVRGWAFWVPAASVNFWFVPLPYQVPWGSHGAWEHA